MSTHCSNMSAYTGTYIQKMTPSGAHGVTSRLIDYLHLYCLSSRMIISDIVYQKTIKLSSLYIKDQYTSCLSTLGYSAVFLIISSIIKHSPTKLCLQMILINPDQLVHCTLVYMSGQSLSSYCNRPFRIISTLLIYSILKKHRLLMQAGNVIRNIAENYKPVRFKEKMHQIT